MQLFSVTSRNSKFYFPTSLKIKKKNKTNKFVQANMQANADLHHQVVKQEGMG